MQLKYALRDRNVFFIVAVVNAARAVPLWDTELTPRWCRSISIKGYCRLRPVEGKGGVTDADKSEVAFRPIHESTEPNLTSSHVLTEFPLHW